ncbi:MAG TPA: hydroxymethylbilane synthase [Spirochaetota bacterium]|nr:hydroxymethylbilane synthase [Spirochaetota bacterium]HPJ34817.1 hydroxymethylbilane synthase [Spirochaetota bacterium]
MQKKIRIGTRGSELALWQANYVAGLIGGSSTEIVIIKTEGDRIQNVSFNKMEGKGFFTKEIEEALLDNRIDLAVHSLKDLPTDDVEGLRVAAIPERGDYHDILIMHTDVYENNGGLDIKSGSLVGTSSMRRMAQLKSLEPSLRVEALRGNVNTRLRKLKDREYDAIVMAKAGAERVSLDLSEFAVLELDERIFLPAPAQGALGLQIRVGDDYTASVVEKLRDPETERLVKAERSFLKHFGGGCHVPLGALAEIDGDDIILRGIVASPDGTFVAREFAAGADPEEVGAELAGLIKGKGADKYI